jgi:two-component system CheB/CheR fusion protein
MAPKKKNPDSKPAAKAKGERGDGIKRNESAEEFRPEPDAGEKDKTGIDESVDGKMKFPIVGIGASAGGLEALEDFFENLPEQSGMAFVVITHTDPKHTSLLPSILERKTRAAKIRQIEEHMPIEPDTVYLPPSDRDPFIEGETFRLRDRPGREKMHMPVDLFLRSLSAVRGERAGCVILSGTGSDGTYGLRAIKENAGVALVQEPETAKHTGMPSNAIDSGLADFVIPVNEMPGQLIAYFKHPVKLKPVERKGAGKESDQIKKILAHLAQRTHHDFGLYKNGTLERRVARRVAVTHSQDPAEYLQTLYRNEEEVRSLFQDLLIGVTSFFRDPDAFTALKEEALPKIFSHKRRGDTVRVWIPGCATGEEVFSVMILLREYNDENNSSTDIQVFGTDIDRKAIEKARTGAYLTNIAADVSPERLKRFFDKQGERYRVKSEIREPVVFAEQNLLRDPPFSNLDLLVCRNLLIYLKPEAQKKLIPLFHYSLRPHGILFLGNSESIGRFPELFEPLGKKHSIFLKRETALRPPVQFPAQRYEPTSAEARQAESEEPAGAQTIEEAVDALLLAEFTPACIIVDPKGEIVYTRGRTGKYLELAPGKPLLNVAEMAREGLRFVLLAALREARARNEPVVRRGVRVKTNGENQWVDLRVKHINRPPMGETFMVAFHDREAPESSPAAAGGDDGEQRDVERIDQLEQALSRARQEYSGAMEQLESSNEELRSTNEEMQSANEELQSSNEELESSREELQSLNEELNTVNSELQNKMQEIHESYRAVTRVLDSTQIAMVFLDQQLRIVRFTQAVTQLIKLIDTDMGRPLEHIADNLDIDNLSEMAARVLKTLRPVESEVKTDDGHWYRMNIMAHRRKNHFEGVVLTFVNIDKQVKARQELEDMRSREVKAAKQFAESIVDTVKEALLVLDGQMRVITANRRFLSLFAATEAETQGKSLFAIDNGAWDIPELRRLLGETLSRRNAFENFRVEHRFPKAGLKKMVLNGRLLREEDSRLKKILLAIEDETDRRDDCRELSPTDEA